MNTHPIDNAICEAAAEILEYVSQVHTSLTPKEADYLKDMIVDVLLAHTIWITGSAMGPESRAKVGL